MWKPKKEGPSLDDIRTKKSYIYWICSMNFHMHDESFSDLWQCYRELDATSQWRIQKKINKDKPLEFEDFRLRLKEYRLEVILQRARGILRDKWWKDKQEYYKKAGPIEGETTLDGDGQFGLEL